jgi:hypothetical protein
MEQAATGKEVPGALDPLGTSVLIVSGHDTNLSNLSGMLGLSWRLPGYQPNDTLPGGALIFSLWQRSKFRMRNTPPVEWSDTTLKARQSRAPTA